MATEKPPLLAVRMAQSEIDELDIAAKQLQITRSDVVRALLPQGEAWMLALLHAAQQFANGDLNGAVTALLAEGLKHRMVSAGVEPTTLDPLRPHAIAAAYLEYNNALAAYLGIEPPFDLRPRTYRLERPPPGGELERTGRTGLVVLADFEELTPDGVRLRAPGEAAKPATPDVWTVERMLSTLRSPHAAERERAAWLLMQSVVEGLVRQGKTRDEALLAWAEVGPLLDRAVAGDEAAAEALAARVTNNPAPPKAEPPPPVEPTAVERALAEEHDANELLELLARKGPSRNRRRELVHALIVRVGADGGVATTDSEAAREFCALGDRLVDRDAKALELARQWVARHLIVRAPAE